MQKEYAELIEKHVKSLRWLREELLSMDSLINSIMGIKDWDDACCVEFGNKKLIASVDGPYDKRLVMKSALIHAATDVVVKGAKPLFALDTVTGSERDIKEMVRSLKIQALEMKIPLLGGNTKIKSEAKPTCSLVVIGELLLQEPVRDSGAKKGDVLALLAEPLWGEQPERIKKAKILFKTWYQILASGIKIHAAKDVTKGGLISTLFEISTKAKRRYNLEKNIPFSLTRNLDNFLISVAPRNHQKIEKICEENKCPFCQIGKII